VRAEETSGLETDAEMVLRKRRRMERVFSSDFDSDETVVTAKKVSLSQSPVPLIQFSLPSISRGVFHRVLTPPGKSLIFISKISRTWKVLENEFGTGKSWKLNFKVLESSRIYCDSY